MRSRYTAYATGAVDYLLRTTHSSTRHLHDRQTIENWSRSCRWQKLEIISREGGQPKDKRGKVEFKAHYLDENDQPRIHHELSNFVKELGRWYFI